MNKKTKIALWITIPLALLGVGFFIYKKSNGSSSSPSTPPSPLGDSMFATTTSGGKLMTKPSESSAFIDYVDAEQDVVIVDSNYAEGSWWYKLTDVTTSSDPSQGRTGWIKANYLTA